MRQIVVRERPMSRCANARCHFRVATLESGRRPNHERYFIFMANHLGRRCVAVHTSVAVHPIVVDLLAVVGKVDEEHIAAAEVAHAASHMGHVNMALSRGNRTPADAEYVKLQTAYVNFAFKGVDEFLRLADKSIPAYFEFAEERAA